jgi:hypothetical protein
MAWRLQRHCQMLVADMHTAMAEALLPLTCADAYLGKGNRYFAVTSGFDPTAARP